MSVREILNAMWMALLYRRKGCAAGVGWLYRTIPKMLPPAWQGLDAGFHSCLCALGIPPSPAKNLISVESQ